jgi:ribose transport system ATP-binding protein
VLDSGEIYVKGPKVDIKSPRDAVHQGIGYLSEDRKRYGLALGLDVEANIALASFDQFTNGVGMVKAGHAQDRRTLCRRAGDQDAEHPAAVRNLSGGNQQKVVIGKWLTADTDVLIFDEPTRGIDVGAKSEIYRLLNDLAAQGKSIIMISSELPEISAHEPPHCGDV